MADGWPVRAFRWPQPDGRRPCGQLLFLTGRADFAEKYLETLAHWHARGWEVAGFDWRGQGGSRQAEYDLPDLTAMLADLRAFAADWRGRQAGPSVAIGHSMGGYLLLRWLAEGASEVDAAVLVAPMLGLNSRPLPPGIARGVAAVARWIGLGNRPLVGAGAAAIGRQARLTGDADRYADEQAWIARMLEYTVEPPRWNWIADAYAGIAQFARPGILEAITVPMLLVGTVQDRLVDPEAIRRAAARLPHAELELRTDGAHELLREGDPVRNAVLARIDGFLDRFVTA